MRGVRLDLGLVMLRGVSLLPWTHPIVFALFTVRAHLALGHWPAFNRPDPKTLGFELHYAIVWLTLFPALYSPLVVLPGVLACWRALRETGAFRSVAFTYIAGTAVTWFVWATDLGGFPNWFVD